MSIDEMIVRHGAPTLAGLKIAALICIPCRSCRESYEQLVEHYNQEYNCHGLCFETVCTCKGRRLLYIYRPDKVTAYLACPEAVAFLRRYGFSPEAPLSYKLKRLKERFLQGGAFPHELGVFLGYPVADVEAFIVNGGCREKMCGEWKVYTNTVYAQQEFYKYACCRKDYLQRFYNGTALRELIVA